MDTSSRLWSSPEHHGSSMPTTGGHLVKTMVFTSHHGSSVTTTGGHLVKTMVFTGYYGSSVTATGGHLTVKAMGLRWPSWLFSDHHWWISSQDYGLQWPPWIFSDYHWWTPSQDYGLHWPVPTVSPSRGGDVTVHVYNRNQPSLPTPFCSVLVSTSGFMALSTVFHSINSRSDNCFLTQFFRAYLCLISSFNYISLYENLLQP